MNIEDVIEDIKKLAGLELESIRPGAGIMILSVDEERGSIMLETSSGKRKSRPLAEIRKIWNELMSQPAVHVEGVLRGSGTSRNQPETIFANLPYIEWLKVDNKKHIAFVGRKTHVYGTVKHMDEIAAAEMNTRIKADKSGGTLPLKAVIVSADVAASIKEMQDFRPGTVETLGRGMYRFITGGEAVVFLTVGICGLDAGTYCVINTAYDVDMLADAAENMTIDGIEYSVFCKNDVKIFARQR